MDYDDENITALEEILFYFADEESSPLSRDNATDRIFSFTEADWNFLDDLWWSQDALWKERCANLIMVGPERGYFLLKRGLFDSNNSVSLTAAYGISDIAVVSFEDEYAPKIDLDDAMIARLKEVLAMPKIYKHIADTIKTLLSRINPLYPDEWQQLRFDL